MVDNPSDLVGKEFIFEYGVDRILPPSDKTGGVFATEHPVSPSMLKDGQVGGEWYIDGDPRYYGETWHIERWEVQ